MTQAIVTNQRFKCMTTIGWHASEQMTSIDHMGTNGNNSPQTRSWFHKTANRHITYTLMGIIHHKLRIENVCDETNHGHKTDVRMHDNN